MDLQAPIRAERLSSLVAKELTPAPCWIEPAILPKRGTMLFGGCAKIGKSFIMLELARALATGARPFGCPDMAVDHRARVLFVEQELGEYGLQKRVKTVFAKERGYEEYLWYVSKEPSLQLDSSEGRRAVYNLIEQVKPNVLIFDPMGMMHAYDENDATQIGKLFNHLERMKKSFQSQDLSIIFSHHFKKPPEKDDRHADHDPLSPYNFRGSTRWYDNPDMLVTVDRLKNLDTPWTAWEFQSRWIPRHGEEFGDHYFTVNRDNDLRVRYARPKQGKLRPLVVGPNPTPLDPPATPKKPGEQQVLFAPA